MSQPTTPQRVQKEVSTPIPLLYTAPVQNKNTPKIERKPKNQPHSMIVNNKHPVQEYCGLDCIIMVCIKNIKGAKVNKYTEAITGHTVSSEQE